MKNPIHILKKYIKVVYYYVPPCPECKSTITGHFITLRRDNVAEWQIDEALKHGELVKPLKEIGIDNCFCLNCGNKWPGIVETKFLSLNEIEQEKTKRQTREILNARVSDERERQRNDHGAFKSVRKFIGKL